MAQDDDFANLPQAEFDGVVFPIISARLSHGSALAAHKFPHRPGQRIEPTGREPINGQMVAPMFSTLVMEGAGRTAHWPTGVQLLREKAQQQKPGRLVCPPFGTLDRAYIRVDETFDATHRDGAFLTVSFFEDSTDTIAKGTAPTSASMVPALASSLDNQMAALRIALAQRIEDGEGNSYTDFVTACGALVAMKDNAQQSLANRVTMASRIVGALDGLLREAAGVLSDPLGWETREAILNLKDNVTTLAGETTELATPVRTFTVAAAMTAADVARATGNTVQEVIDLNALPDPGDIATGEILVVFERS